MHEVVDVPGAVQGNGLVLACVLPDELQAHPVSPVGFPVKGGALSGHGFPWGWGFFIRSQRELRYVRLKSGILKGRDEIM